MKVQELQGGTLVVTIPKALAVALGIVKGTEIDFKIEGEHLYVTKN